MSQLHKKVSILYLKLFTNFDQMGKGSLSKSRLIPTPGQDTEVGVLESQGLAQKLISRRHLGHKGMYLHLLYVPSMWHNTSPTVGTQEASVWRVFPRSHYTSCIYQVIHLAVNSFLFL